MVPSHPKGFGHTRQKNAVLCGWQQPSCGTLHLGLEGEEGMLPYIDARARKAAGRAGGEASISGSDEMEEGDS